MEPFDTEKEIRRVVEQDGHPAVVAVYLFGSVAEGRQHGESDVDVGVLLDRRLLPAERERFEQRLALSSALSRVRGRAGDVVILNDAPPTLSRAIVTRGKRVLCRDAEAEHAFVRDVLLQAPDLEKFLERMRAIKLRALAER